MKKVKYNQIVKRTKSATLYRFEDGFCEWLANSICREYGEYIEIYDYVYNTKFKTTPHELYSYERTYNTNGVSGSFNRLYNGETELMVFNSFENSEDFIESEFMASTSYLDDIY